MIAPTKIIVSAAVLDVLQQAGISTAFDPEISRSNEGWIAKLDSYQTSCAFTVEGPCGFYGGVYGPNAWTIRGGFCEMGAGSYSHSPLPEGLIVGRYCSIAKGVRFMDFAHPAGWATTSVPFFQAQGVSQKSSLRELCELAIASRKVSTEFRTYDPTEGKPYPRVHHDVWIGENVALAMGITIGTGAIIASGAIVTKDVPPYAVVAGVPAAVKKMRFDDVTIAALLESEWWSYDFVALSQFDVTNPLVFARSVSKAVANGTLLPWRPKCVRIPDDLLELSQGVGDMG